MIFIRPASGFLHDDIADFRYGILGQVLLIHRNGYGLSVMITRRPANSYC